jgi:hypothetical protein
VQARSTLLVALVIAGAVVGSAAGASGSRSAAVTCGQVITANTTLTRNVRNCPGNGLVVAAPNVTLDLGGYTVSGSGGGFGITVAADGVTVRNGTVTNFSSGIDGEGGYLQPSANGAVISALTIRNNVTAGITSISVDGWQIQNNNLTQNGDGIDFVHATNMVASGNRIANSTWDGIYSVSSSDNATLSGNTTVFNGGDGILVSNSTTQIVGNRANHNAVNGIELHDSLGFPDRIADNIANYNGQLGMTADFPSFDGGGNAGLGNGDPRQCVNVVCA